MVAAKEIGVDVAFVHFHISREKERLWRLYSPYTCIWQEFS